jgi:hypothetical protein
VPEPSASKAPAERGGAPALLNTVVISLAISLVSLAVAAVNVYYTTLRPASIAMTLTLVAETSRGGQRIVIPTSISNEGAQSATILNAKLIESEPDRQSLWGAKFAAPVSSMIDIINDTDRDDVGEALFVPFQIQPHSQFQTVLVFTPTDTPGFANALLARGGETLRYTVVLNTTAGDVTVANNVTWPGVTNGALDKGAFGVAAATHDVNAWFDTTTPVPYPSISP